MQIHSLSNKQTQLNMLKIKLTTDHSDQCALDMHPSNKGQRCVSFKSGILPKWQVILYIPFSFSYFYALLMIRLHVENCNILVDGLNTT